MNKLVTFVEDKSPFGIDPNLKNIVNGVVAAESVNVTKAEEIGGKILEEMVGKQVVKYTFKKKKKKPGSNNGFKVNNLH